MTSVASNRNRNFTDEVDNMSILTNENLDDSGLELMDEKRVRKAVFRRTIDYNSSVTLQQEQRLLRRKYTARNALQPDIQYQHLLTPPQDYKDNPMNCVCVKHVRTSTNKNKCPIYSVCWTPDGRRLITAASSGEFTLWNGLTFNFETILQAHDTYIKAMKWSHNEEWLLSGDDLGMVKYWQANMNDVNVFQAHKDAIRGLSFCPSDKKFVTCSVDNTVRIWDFQLCKEERVLRGHGGEVKCVAWHPTKALVLSGSKDSQQPLKLWDPKAGECISTMYVHKSSCNDIAINKNGNWFLSASKDHTIKLFDLRNLKSEMQVFRGHKKDVFRVAWNPFHENLFASGSGDGALMYWMAGTDMEVGSVDDAHDNIIWSIDWHPMGHILATGSNDFATKFWTRNRPGDVLKDNQQVDHNVSSAPRLETTQSTDAELDKIIKRVKKEGLEELDLQKLSSSIEADLEKSEKILSDIPGLSEGLLRDIEIDSGDEDAEEREAKLRGSSYRVIPKQFVLNWADKKKHPAAYINVEPNQPKVPPPIIVVPSQGSEPVYQSPIILSQQGQKPTVTPLMSANLSHMSPRDKSPPNRSHSKNKSRDSSMHQSRDAGKHHSRDARINHPRDAGINHPRDAGINHPRDTGTHQSRDAPMNQSRDAPMNQSRDALMQQSRDASMQQSGDAPMHQLREVPMHQSRDAPMHQSRDTPEVQFDNFPPNQAPPLPPPRRSSPGFIMDAAPVRYPKMETTDNNEPPVNHNGQGFPRFPSHGFRQNRPFNRRMRPFEHLRNMANEEEGAEALDVDMEEEVEEEIMFRDDEDFLRDSFERERERPRFQGHRPPLPRNIHPSNPDFLFERPPQRPPPRHFRPQNSEPLFGFQLPNQRMFPPNHSEMQYQRPPRNFNQDRPFMPPPQRPLVRGFRAPFDGPLHQRPPLRHFQPQNQSDGPFHPPQPRQPSAAPPRHYGPSGPFEPRVAVGQRPLLRAFGPPSQSENPFEPQKSTGSSKGFIPLPFNSDEAQNQRNRPNLGNRPGPNW